MYLLDTHAFIWFLNDDAKMPEAGINHFDFC